MLGVIIIILYNVIQGNVWSDIWFLNCNLAMSDRVAMMVLPCFIELLQQDHYDNNQTMNATLPRHMCI